MQSYFFSLASLLITVAAQNPTPTDSQPLTTGISTETPTASVPPCVLQCLTQAAQTVGCGTMDKTCACTNASFQQASRTCLQSTCSPFEQATAALLQENQCTTVVASSISQRTQTAPASTFSPNDALTIGYGVGNIGWVAVAGALGIIVAF